MYITNRIVLSIPRVFRIRHSCYLALFINTPENANQSAIAREFPGMRHHAAPLLLLQRKQSALVQYQQRQSADQFETCPLFSFFTGFH